MFEPKDVIQDSSLDDEDVIDDKVTEDLLESSTDEDLEQGGISSDPEDVKESVDAEDEVILPTDRPAKNVVAELQRKLDKANQDMFSVQQSSEQKLAELYSKMNELVNTMESNKGSQELTRDQLTRLAQSDLENRDVYLSEINKIDMKELIDSKLSKITEATETQKKQEKQNQVKSQSFEYVKNAFPDGFNSDGSWNNSNPVVSRIAQILHTIVDPLSGRPLKDHPSGLVVAFNQAFTENAMRERLKVTKTLTTANRKVKKLQKGGLTEGKASATPASDNKTKKLNSLYEQGMKKGDVSAYLKEAGFVPNID